jgi:hypothetical protein
MAKNLMGEIDKTESTVQLVALAVIGIIIIYVLYKIAKTIGGVANWWGSTASNIGKTLSGIGGAVTYAEEEATSEKTTTVSLPAPIVKQPQIYDVNANANQYTDTQTYTTTYTDPATGKTKTLDIYTIKGLQ